MDPIPMNDSLNLTWYGQIQHKSFSRIICHSWISVRQPNCLFFSHKFYYVIVRSLGRQYLHQWEFSLLHARWSIINISPSAISSNRLNFSKVIYFLLFNLFVPLLLMLPKPLTSPIFAIYFASFLVSAGRETYSLALEFYSICFFLSSYITFSHFSLFHSRCSFA